MLENPEFLHSIPADPPGHFPLLHDAAALLQSTTGSLPTVKKASSDGISLGTDRVSPEAVVHSIRSRKLEQKRQEQFRSLAVTAAAAELVPDEAVG